MGAVSTDYKTLFKKSIERSSVGRISAICILEKKTPIAFYTISIINENMPLSQCLHTSLASLQKKNIVDIYYDCNCYKYRLFYCIYTLLERL